MIEATNKAMAKLATKVAEDLYEGDWTAELVTREIATAENRADAIKRLETLMREVERAMEIVRGA